MKVPPKSRVSDKDNARVLRQIERVLGHAGIGFDIIDSGYNVKYIDPAWRKVYGDTEGKKCFQYFMGRRNVCLNCGVRKAFRTGKKAVTEETLIAENNRPIQVITVPYRGERGERLVAEVNVDISRLKNAEKSLRDSEARYRQLFEANNDAIFIADARTRRLIDCNKKAEEVLGYSRAKILSMKAEHLHPSDLVNVTMGGFRQLVSGKPIFIRSELLTKSGSRIPVEISGTMLNVYGKDCLMGVFRDISERRRHEDELAKSEYRYRTLAEIAEDPIYVINRAGRIEYLNSYAAGYFSKRPAEMIGRKLSEFYDPGVYRVMMRDIRKAMRTGKAVFTYREFEFHGSKFWLDTRLTPMRGESGKIEKILGISRDVTTLKKAEEVLKRDNVKLERLISQSSKKLLDAQKRIDRKERLAEIGTLSATVAHELRSPLAAIGVAAYNIRAKSRDPRLDNNLKNIEIKVLESDQIIKNLLSYSGIKAPIREHVRLSDILDESVELAQSRHPGQNIMMPRVFRCSHDIGLDADPVQLQEIFTNILNNSFEAIGKRAGKIKIDVSVSRRNTVEIRFSDNGPGMGPDKMRHLFEPFYSTKAAGTGLGLPVCKQMIELHGGAIDIKSKSGKGTIVVVSLPLTHKERT